MIIIPADELAALLASWTGVPTFEGAPNDNLDGWLSLIELRCRKDAVPYAQWPDVGLRFLGALMHFAMDARRQAAQAADGAAGAGAEWTWPVFRSDLARIHEEARKPAFVKAVQELHALALAFQAEHPRLIAIAGTAFVSVGLSLVVPAAGFLLLRLAGFGAAGPVAGTFAPWFQSVFWGGKTAGLFSVLQRVGMTMAGPSAIIGGVGTALTGLGGLMGLKGKKPKPPGGAPGDEPKEDVKKE